MFVVTRSGPFRLLTVASGGNPRVKLTWRIETTMSLAKTAFTYCSFTTIFTLMLCSSKPAHMWLYYEWHAASIFMLRYPSVFLPKWKGYETYQESLTVQMNNKHQVSAFSFAFPGKTFHSALSPFTLRISCLRLFAFSGKEQNTRFQPSSHQCGAPARSRESLTRQVRAGIACSATEDPSSERHAESPFGDSVSICHWSVKYTTWRRRRRCVKIPTEERNTVAAWIFGLLAEPRFRSLPAFVHRLAHGPRCMHIWRELYYWKEVVCVYFSRKPNENEMRDGC